MHLLRIQPEAERDVTKIIDWYEAEQTGLGLRFHKHFRESLMAIKDNPFRFAIAFDDFRQGFVKRFRYIIYYRVDGEMIIVYRVIHASRNQEDIWGSLSTQDH